MARKYSSDSSLLEEQQSMVLHAAEQGLSNLVLIAMDVNPAVDVTQIAAARSAKEVPLITACLKGHLDVARNLVEKCHASLDSRADVMVENQPCKGVTPLWAAACNGNLDLVQYLVQKGASVNMTNMNQSSPLRAAAFDGYLPVVKFLVEKGADVNNTNSYGVSVLMATCFKEHKDVAEYLLDHGADVNYTIPEKGHESGLPGCTALHYCAERGSVELCKLLLAHGATITRDCNNESPLLTAAKKGYDDVVNYLMDTPDFSRDDKADALELLGTEHWKKNDGKRCLSLWQRAMEERYRPGKPVVWKRKGGSKVPACDNAVEVQTMDELKILESSHTMYQLGLQSWLIRERVLGRENSGTTDIIKRVGEYHIQDKRYDRALEVLISALDNMCCVCPFNSHAVNIYAPLLYILNVYRNVEGPGKITFLQALACLKRALSDFKRGDADQGQSKTEAFLVSRGELLKIILHVICLLRQAQDKAAPDEKREFSETVTSLVRAGCCGQKGNTPLHLACDEKTSDVVRCSLENYKKLKFPSPEVVQVLLEAGSDVSARNDAGETALQVARTQVGGNSVVINMLLSAGAV